MKPANVSCDVTTKYSFYAPLVFKKCVPACGVGGGQSPYAYKKLSVTDLVYFIRLSACRYLYTHK